MAQGGPDPGFILEGLFHVVFGRFPTSFRPITITLAGFQDLSDLRNPLTRQDDTDMMKIIMHTWPVPVRV